METNNPEHEQLKQTIAKVDNKTPTPSDRANKVYKILMSTEVSNWDCVCFAAEFLGMMVPVMPWIEKSAKEISKLVYTQHYLLSEDVIEAESATAKVRILDKEHQNAMGLGSTEEADKSP
jgi:hypothetical protein